MKESAFEQKSTVSSQTGDVWSEVSTIYFLSVNCDIYEFLYKPLSLSYTRKHFAISLVSFRRYDEWVTMARTIRGSDVPQSMK